MKRMNFTFFLLFALLSFVSSQLVAQSSSCIDEVNITVDADCGFDVDAAVLGATGPAAMATRINYGGTGSGTAFPGSGSLESLFGSNRPGSVQYELFNATGQMLCWGTINFEIKNTPDPVIVDTAFMCGQLEGYLEYLNKYHSVGQVLARNSGACSVDLSNAYANVTRTEDKCLGNTYTREIWATGSVDGAVRKILLRRDAVTEMPIDIATVLPPANDFTYQPAGVAPIDPPATTVYVPCDFGTSPEDIADEFGDEVGYPHLMKASDTTIVERDTIYVLDSTDIRKILIEDADTGIEYWVETEVVIKYDSVATRMDTTITPVKVPVKKGTQCNLSTKCTDWGFEGCYGPESKIMRTWDIIDWCAGTTQSFTQWIVVVPAEDDKYRLDFRNGRGYRAAYYAPIAPWTCSATIVLPALPVRGGCSEPGPTTYTTDAGVLNGNVLSNIWITECPIRVDAYRANACGERLTDWFYVLPYDDTPPVAVAEDRVNVSLTADPSYTTSPDGGVAKVYYDAIDAGSHDAGCGEVDKCLLLKEELDNPLDFVGYYSTSPNVRRVSDLAWNNGEQAAIIGGKHIYLAAQCVADGTVYLYEDVKGRPVLVGSYDYVICKDYVKFCCEDLGENEVALVVTDNAAVCQVDGLDPIHPNVSYSWTTVNVEDKSGANWNYTPEYVDCKETIDWEPRFKPTYGGVICNQFDVREISREEDVTCGIGYLFITYGAYDADGNLLDTETFEYWVNPSDPFDPYEIKWPKHYDGTEYYGVIRECEDVVVNRRGYTGIIEYPDYIPMGDTQDCVAGMDTGEPVWCNTTCGLIGSSYEIDTVSASDACYKLIKRWTIIDWCVWEPNGVYDDDENDTYYDQFQAVDDEWLREAGYADAYTSVQKQGYFAADGTYVPYPKCEDCEKPSGDVDDVYFRYLYVDHDGYYTFDQVIKVVDDVEPEIAVVSDTISIVDGNDAKLPADYDPEEDDAFEDCYANVQIPATATDMCGDLDLTAVGARWWIERTLYDADGNARYYDTKSDVGESTTMSTGPGEPGWFAIITWRVTDGCGNNGFAESRHDFIDAKNPTPVCIQDISTAAMNTDGSVAIWAEDYDLGSFDNCSDVEVYFKDEDGNKISSMAFTCDDIGTNELAMYVSDAYGNEDFCFVTLRIDDNTGICGEQTGASILGEIATPSGDMVESATVALSVGAQDLTDVQGKYAFRQNTGTYDVKASKADDYMNGVSTLDLVLIQKHVLGLQTLDSPYKVIAADINSDENVSAIDLVELRKLILGIYTELPNNDSWRFIDANQEFADASSPFPFVEQISVDLGTQDAVDQNFIGAKVGDVSGNAIANSLIASEGRSAGRLALQIEDATVPAGELVDVAVSADAFDNISAYQFTMAVEGLELVSVTPGAVDMTEESIAVLDENTITAAWFNTAAVSTSDALFTLTFRAKSDVSLSSAIALNSSVTKAEAYTATADKLDLSLTFDSEVASNFALFQNEPNPFNDVTRISYELPQAGEATLTVFDVTGKTVTQLVDQANKGVNFFELRKADLNASGVMYYQLESGEFTATKKMIVIE